MRYAKGFTLIELLVVVAIVGILAAIAIPQVAAYRQRGFDARAISDLHAAAVGEEAYFASYERYVSCTNDDCNDPALPGFQLSDRTSLIMILGTLLGGDEFFVGVSWSNSGTRRFYIWVSITGGYQTAT